MTTLFQSLRRKSDRFARDEGGNVAMIWGLAAVVLVGMVGVALDFSNANSAKAHLQNAADAAVLVAERMADKPFAEREAAAEQFFRASLTSYPEGSSAVFAVEALSGGGHKVTASMPARSGLSRLISERHLVVRTSSEARQEGTDLEVALVLDITGSMGGQRIVDLKAAANDLVDIVVREEQEPYYSKVALVPYSIGVNLGADAADARGAVTPPTAIVDASWKNGAAKAMTGATRANPVVITSAGHGFDNGDYVRITGVSGMTQINNRIFQVANRTANTFQLAGVNGSTYSNYSSGGSIQKCFTATCEVQVTAAAHGLANNDYVFIVGVNGMTQINNAANTTWQVSNVSANTFVLKTTNGPAYGAFTNGGQAYCTVAGCEYFRFTNASNNLRVHRISTCVSERIGGNAYNDVAPAVARVGRVYASTSNPCPGATVMPLTNDKDALRAEINSYTVTGSTAGQIGIAWGWYMVSPNFSSLWPAASQPKAYGSPNLRKIAVLMTDGEFNTPYCNGVIAQNAGSGSGSTADKINCNATNGNPFDQAREVCEAMKDAGVTVYTVGFGLSGGSEASEVLEECASGSANAFNASNGAELRDAFRSIATAISLLRLSR